MKVFLVFLGMVSMVVALSCSDTSADQSNSDGAQTPNQTATNVDAAAPVIDHVTVRRSELGHIKAKANEKTAEIEFDVKTAVLANFYDKFFICLSDVANDEVRSSGQFPPAPDNSGPYHKITIGLEPTPTAPGEFVLTKLSYSVKDADLHFNFGWQGDSVAGKVVLDSVEGTLPEEGGGIRARPAKIKGRFEATNTYGGVFSGTFEASGIPPAE